MKISRLFLFAVCLCAQNRSRNTEGLDAIQAAHLKADLTFLASEPLGGRLSLDRGSEIAIQWIASEFDKAGLKPLAGGSFLQTVPLIEYRPDRQLSRMVLYHQGKQEIFRAPDAFGGFPRDTNVRGSVVFAGFGITAPELKYDDYAGIDARGKLVLIFNHEPQENDAKSVFAGTGNTRWANNRAKMLNALGHGAVGVLTMADPNHPRQPQQQTPAQPQQQQGGRGGRGGGGAAFQRPTQALADEPAIPVFTLSEKVSAMLFEAAGKKSSGVQTGIDATLKPASFAIPGVEIELSTVNSSHRRANSANVIGMIEGSDPQLRQETIIFSAHYDHDGPAPAGGFFPGADDDGSGTVGVVELARAFSTNPVKPKRSVLFAVFAAEERGLLGSYYYVAHPLRPLAGTRAVINFDMIGRNEAHTNATRGRIEIAEDTSNEMNLVGTNLSPDYRSAVERANSAIGLKLNYKFDADASQNVLFRSDQYPFLLRDIPAVWWFTGFHPDYHQTTDTADRINYPKMEKILKLAFMTGFEFADGRPPAFAAVPTR
jgi:hypothetical protein